MAIPPKIEVNEREYDLCKKHRKVLDYIYKTDDLISQYNNKLKPKN